MAFEIKRNDRRPRFRVQLTQDGVPADLTGNAAVRFTLTDASTSAIKINKAAMSVVDAPTGVVEYVWAATDTDTAGTYNAEVEVDWGTSITQTFPTKGYFVVTIYADLA